MRGPFAWGIVTKVYDGPIREGGGLPDCLKTSNMVTHSAPLTHHLHSPLKSRKSNGPNIFPTSGSLLAGLVLAAIPHAFCQALSYHRVLIPEQRDLRKSEGPMRAMLLCKKASKPPPLIWLHAKWWSIQALAQNDSDNWSCKLDTTFAWIGYQAKTCKPLKSIQHVTFICVYSKGWIIKWVICNLQECGVGCQFFIQSNTRVLCISMK